MIAVIDYGAGNLRSVGNLLESMQRPYTIATTRNAIQSASKIILPGVGHFGQMMRSLDDLKIRAALTERIRSGVPFLGICLGMQALFERSAEAPEAAGLGIFKGAIERFPYTVRVPQMGWNRVESSPQSRLLQSFPSNSWFYFAHSYYLPECSLTAGVTEYSLRYSSVIERGNIFGVQFHPEKSSDSGRDLLASFLEL
jgi:imidazole glycerol phosphate synthase glutamine amidotransferase subunit